MKMKNYKLFLEQYSFVNENDDDQDFRDAHSAPRADHRDSQEKMKTGGDFSLSEVIKGYHGQASDYFDPRLGPRYYMYNDTEGMQSLTAINNVKRAVANNKPTNLIAYRAVPNDIDVDELKRRDWISFSKQYVINHGESRFGEDEYKIIQQKVSPDEVWWDGNDIREWGFDPS